MFTSLDSMGCNLITLQDLEWLDRLESDGMGMGRVGRFVGCW